MRKISKKVVEFVAQDNYTKEEKEEMDYVLRTILFESIKLISTIVIFSILGYFIESVIIISIMSLTKPFIGGYHEDTQLKCFIATMLLTAGILILSLNTSFTFWGNCIVLIICIFCIYNQAPVINPKMPITHPHLIQKNRDKGLCNVIVLGIVSIMLYKYSDYYLLITWTIVFQTILMFNKREKNKS
ncbi:accessory gene regulator ArgB-like protein [Clostridium neonatale]|uniref:accessory gene regulator ArgB-like protein n=1 Tax=Clostridium neonatale TaxID=137838 RepID=UPI00132FBAD3|nr:accessory gene regulator B family protein [Clostridium neonatale]